MIKLEPKIVEGLIDGPIRELTAEEKATVTRDHFDGTNFIYYQEGDPQPEPIEEVKPPNWLGLEQALFYSGLRAKAKASANLDQFEYASLIGAFGNGHRGFTSENTLIYLLHAINADWDSKDIETLNSILQQNNFTVRYT